MGKAKIYTDTYCEELAMTILNKLKKGEIYTVAVLCRMVGIPRSAWSKIRRFMNTHKGPKSLVPTPHGYRLGTHNEHMKLSAKFHDSVRKLSAAFHKELANASQGAGSPEQAAAQLLNCDVDPIECIAICRVANDALPAVIEGPLAQAALKIAPEASADMRARLERSTRIWGPMLGLELPSGEEERVVV